MSFAALAAGVPCLVLGVAGLAPEAAPWTVPLLLVLGVAVLVVARRQRRRRGRPDGVEEWAREHGWSHEQRSAAVLSRWSVAPFGRGGLRQARDVLRGEVGGVPVTSFSYVVVTNEYGYVGSVAERHVLMATLPVHLPVLTLTPESNPHVSATLGPRDLQLESVDFNDRWRVQSADERFAHAFCHARLMERLLADDARDVSVLVEGSDVVVHAPGATVVDLVEERAALLVDLVRLLPPYVAADHPAPARRRRRRDRG